MSIAVEVPGLDSLLSGVEDGTIVVVEGGADLAKSYFVRRLCLTALHDGRPVSFITSRDARELQEVFARENGHSTSAAGGVKILERDQIDSLSDYVPSAGLLAVDSFSFLTLGVDPAELARMLRDLHTLSREKGSTALLATDKGMMDPRAEAIVTHLAEGHIAFHAQEGPEGLVRFLRIPKWADGRFVDRNIYYDFDGRRMAIDLRSRVL